MSSSESKTIFHLNIDSHLRIVRKYFFFNFWKKNLVVLKFIFSTKLTDAHIFFSMIENFINYLCNHWLRRKFNYLIIQIFKILTNIFLPLFLISLFPFLHPFVKVLTFSIPQFFNFFQKTKINWARERIFTP